MKCLDSFYVRKVSDFVPCGKCIYCLMKRRNDWTFRLKNELKHSLTSFFVTLTYKDAPEQLIKKDLQLFHKRLRKLEGLKIKYYSIGEYGEQFNRPHYHGIYFNVLNPENFHKAWKSKMSNGFVHIGTVTTKSIHYVTGYIINKLDNKSRPSAEWSLMSKNLGSQYMMAKDHHVKLKKDFVIMDGHKHALPRYYRNKFFSKPMRDNLRTKAIEKEIEKYNNQVKELVTIHQDPAEYLYERDLRNKYLTTLRLTNRKKILI